ncbi:hypothetical protein SH580_10845 [Coraliomargarita algicola]|uniref:Uncharacterized protein n=1 Tax=Coraliomargarita algicola TaxID=3092156 RepID=A0ABZ0RSY6_9BACT|nr:hypothetical protein [Coraliomargarita sp. J2-16]WPJ98196.1 hypothetical protein SH580_10845 [Coraliomargarita sp. J2-16]
MKSKINTLASLGLLALGSTLTAQGGFVLFDNATAEIAPEQKAVRPISAPYFHEDSFVTTDVRAWYVRHDFDSDTKGVLGNGSATVMAVQVRVALTESLQFVAYKDGYTEFDDASALDDNSGWNDIGAGIKWAFIQDWENQFHMAAGIGYEFSFGDEDVLQDSDELRLWLSANKGFDKLHLGATVNAILSEDDSDSLLGNSDMLTVHLHADYYLAEWFSPVVEVNGYFAQDDSPTALAAVNFSGVDAGSLPGGDGEDTYTIAFGGELRVVDGLGLRVAYETELNDNDSLFGDRWTLSAVYEF